MDNIERTRQVRYELFSRALGLRVIQEPKGWSDDKRSFDRDKDSRGILIKTDINLQFYGEASEYLKAIYFGYGIEEKVTLTKYEKDKFSLNENWIIKYVQELDMGTFKEVSRTSEVTVKATQGGLYTDVKNRYSDEYDLLNNTSPDGDFIDELTTNAFEPLGRGIFIQSLLEADVVDYRVNSDDTRRSTTYNSRTIPLEVVYNSDKEDVTNVSNAQSFFNNADHQEKNNTNVLGNDQKITDQFFYRAENKKTIKIKLDLDLKIVKNENIGNLYSSIFIELRKSELVGVDDSLIEKTVLLEITNPQTKLNQNFIINGYEKEISLEKNESLSIVITFIKLQTNKRQKWWFNIKSKLIIEDITTYEDFVSVSRCIKPFDLFDRILSKITSKKGLFKSSLFEEGGEYEYMVCDNGLFARGFPNEYENADGDLEKIQFVTSFKDAFDSYNYIEPLAWFTEFIGNKEYLRVEKATYTQQNFIGVDLGNVDKIETESSKIDFFSSIELGHEKSLEYEEINGLDESNGKSEFSTFIKKNISKYSATCKYRTDAIGYELTRRKNFINFPKEDTKRDNDIWIHDAKLVGEVITHRKWDDIFDSLPTGVYDPETSWNLYLSPMNRLYYGHGYSVKRGLYHYPNKSIRFNSSNSNQNLKTVIGGFELSEDGSILIKDIEKPRIEATKTTFSFRITQRIENILTSSTKINGIDVPNYFGLIKYLEKGEESYGRLVKLESSQDSKITLIKARL